MIFNDVTLKANLAKPQKLEKKLLWKISSEKICLKIDLPNDYTPIFSSEILSDFVAEWFKASEFMLDRLVKNWGGSGGQKIFLFFLKFDLRSNFVFTLFFKPYVTFLLLYMAIFLKMGLPRRETQGKLIKVNNFFLLLCPRGIR